MAEILAVGGPAGPGEGPSSFILRPGGTAGGNVYTTWASLVAAYAAGANQSLPVVFDDSIVSPIVLPANTANAPWVVPYDMIWAGKHLGKNTVVHLADGFRMQGPGGQMGVSRLTDQIQVHCLADSGVSNLSPFNPTVADELVIEYGAGLQSDVDMVALVCPALLQTTVALGIGGSINAGATPAVSIPATAVCLLVAAATFCSVAAGTFTGAGALSTVISGPTTTVLTAPYQQPLVTAVSTQYLNPPTAIPDPPADRNADTTAAALVNEPISVWVPSATRKIDVRDAPFSMGLTIIKNNALAFGVVIDVTTGGNQGWTTPAGLNTDYTLFNSAAASQGSWLVRIDRPNKTVIVTPVV